MVKNFDYLWEKNIIVKVTYQDGEIRFIRCAGIFAVTHKLRTVLKEYELSKDENVIYNQLARRLSKYSDDPDKIVNIELVYQGEDISEEYKKLTGKDLLEKSKKDKGHTYNIEKLELKIKKEKERTSGQPEELQNLCLKLVILRHNLSFEEKTSKEYQMLREQIKEITQLRDKMKSNIKKQLLFSKGKSYTEKQWCNHNIKFENAITFDNLEEFKNVQLTNNNGNFLRINTTDIARMGGKWSTAIFENITKRYKLGKDLILSPKSNPKVFGVFFNCLLDEYIKNNSIKKSKGVYNRIIKLSKQKIDIFTTTTVADIKEAVAYDDFIKCFNILHNFKSNGDVIVNPVFGTKVIGDATKFEGITIRGDGDYIISNYIVDIKCSIKEQLQSYHIKQLLIYYCLAKTYYTEYKDLVGGVIYNPLYNVYYKIDFTNIDHQSMIRQIVIELSEKFKHEPFVF